MKKITLSLYTSLRTSPFFGRTIVVLSFFCLFIKQVFIYLAYSETFKEPTFWATIGHYLWYFVSDFLVCMILLGLVGINALIKKTVIKIITNIIISGIFLLFVLDIFTMYFFQSRISILDMSQFINPSLWDFLWMIVSIVIVVSILSIITFFVVQNNRFKKNNKMYLAVYFFLFALASFGVSLYSPGWFTSLPDNIISINFVAFTQNIGNLSEYNIPNTYQKFFGKKRWLNKKPNIIVVFAESLSPIDSLRVGWVHDNLPYFDLIQKQGITFTNFITNGCTSDTAHIWLFLGIEPLKFIGSRVSAYSGYTTYTETLPTFFTMQWYATNFISSVNLDFLNQKSFLSSIGFQKIIGEEAFADKQKYVFDAAPDIDLYDKTLNIIKGQTDPYLIVLQNISFHKPYNTPYGQNQTDALRYTDKSLYYFYLQLKKSGFFTNGLLVIVSDHRKMEPLEAKEKDALGTYRYTKWLATIVGTGITPGTINTNIIQHTDMFYGLKQLVANWFITISKLANDVFSSTKKRDRWIIYCRYFQNNNKFTIVWWPGSGKAFNDLSQINTSHKFIYQYLSSYIAFEQWSWTVLSGKHSMTLIAHQWSWSLGEIPRNSLQAFLKAKEDGADWVEFDISQTKDKQNIVAHGPYLTETTCSKSKVSEYTLEELKKKCQVKNGEPIMTLEEMMNKIKGLFDYYFVEIKVYNQKDAEQQTTAAIKSIQKLSMNDRVIFTSYDKEATYILWSYKNITAWWDTFNLTDLDNLPNMNHPYYLMPQSLIKETTPQEVDDIGKRLVVYTVNTTGDVEKLYREWVRMIMTDTVPAIKQRSDIYLGQ